MALKTFTIVGAVMVSAMVMPAKSQEVCDSSIASGAWTVIAPHLDDACDAVMLPLTEELSFIDLYCPAGGRIMGSAHVGYGAKGEGCRMTLRLASSTSRDPIDLGAPYTYWYCSWCDETFNHRVGTTNVYAACEAMGRNIAPQYGDGSWTLIGTDVLGGTPGDALGPQSEIVIQDALCKWTFHDGSLIDPIRHYQHSTSGVCRADGVGTLSWTLCMGEESNELLWTDTEVDIRAQLPVDEYGDVFTAEVPSVIRGGDIDVPVVPTPLTIIRKNPRMVHPDPGAGASGGVMN
jgi:hypothetical protein